MSNFEEKQNGDENHLFFMCNKTIFENNICFLLTFNRIFVLQTSCKPYYSLYKLRKHDKDSVSTN